MKQLVVIILIILNVCLFSVFYASNGKSQVPYHTISDTLYYRETTYYLERPSDSYVPVIRNTEPASGLVWACVVNAHQGADLDLTDVTTIICEDLYYSADLNNEIVMDGELIETKADSAGYVKKYKRNNLYNLIIYRNDPGLRFQIDNVFAKDTADLIDIVRKVHLKRDSLLKNESKTR